MLFHRLVHITGAKGGLLVCEIRVATNCRSEIKETYLVKTRHVANSWSFEIVELAAWRNSIC